MMRLTGPQEAALAVLYWDRGFVRGWKRSTRARRPGAVHLGAARALVALGYATERSGLLGVEFAATTAGLELYHTLLLDGLDGGGS